jgi:hypothetical protein
LQLNRLRINCRKHLPENFRLWHPATGNSLVEGISGQSNVTRRSSGTASNLAATTTAGAGIQSMPRHREQQRGDAHRGASDGSR